LTSAITEISAKSRFDRERRPPLQMSSTKPKKKAAEDDMRGLLSLAESINGFVKQQAELTVVSTVDKMTLARAARGVACTADGLLLAVIDTENVFVHAVKSGISKCLTVDRPFRMLSGVAVDDRFVYVVQREGDVGLWRIPIAGGPPEAISSSHSSGQEGRSLRDPCGVGVDSSGCLFVADRNDIIQFSPNASAADSKAENKTGSKSSACAI
jgi:hypothetical protein